MPSSFRPPQSERRFCVVDDEREAWDARRSSLATARDRSVAIAIALRGLRSAHALTAILAAVEDVLARYLGADAFALFEPHEASWRAVIAHGLDASEVSDLSGPPRGPSSTALVWCPLRGGEETLGWLAIYRLAYGKRSLDAFDIELIDALGPFVVVAFEEARATAARPTVRPPSMSSVRTK